MPLTAAERQQRRRQKLKDEGRYAEYKKKNNAEALKSRKKKENHISNLPKSKQVKLRKELRENVKKRVAKCRALKNVKVSVLVESNAATPAFKNASALGKATARARRSLPMTPRRKKAVIKRLFETEINPKDSSSAAPQIRSSALPLSTVQLVKQFYENDEISQQAPGRKDVVQVRQDDGTKVKLQTLLLFLKGR